MTEAPSRTPSEPDVLNGRLIATLLAFAEMKLGRETALSMFDTALKGSGVTREHAVDPRGWVPLAVLERVGDAFAPKLGETFITDAFTWAVPIRIDWSAMSLSALTNPTFMMRRLDRARAFFAKHLHYEVDITGPGRARIKLIYAEGQPRRKHSCRVARGVIHGVPMIFDMPPAELTETACYAEGHDACSYEVRFRTEPAYAWIGFSVGLSIAAIGLLLYPTINWLTAPVLGWIIGRETRSYRLRQYMTRVSEEHRRALADNERDFARRYDEIKELNDKLEQRVEARTRELTSAMAALREGNSELRRTIDEMGAIHADVLDAGVRSMLGRAVEEFAHELKNPMTTVLANMQFLEESGGPGSDVGELGLVAHDIRDAVYRMRAVIGWFIELYETNTEEIASPIHEHVQKMTLALGRQWRDRVEITCQMDELVISARGMQLMQVIENLLTNAAQAEGTKTVRVHGYREDRKAKITVTDDGAGIPKDILPRIFERGFTTKQGRGSGLGLFISRAIVERHGGSLIAFSEPGKGAIFELTLPLYENKPASSQVQLTPIARAAKQLEP